MKGLKHPYPSVVLGQESSYGGDQGRSRSAVVRGWGCGAVAGTDLLLYLHQNRPGCDSALFDAVPKKGALSLAGYNALLNRLRRCYFPIIPRIGMNGWMVSLGLNRHFRACRIPLTARWCVWRGGLWNNIERMLENDLPVVLAIGQNFPFFWRQHKLRFYRKCPDGTCRPAAAAKAHFVTVTGMEERWLRISSWGKEYYIDREEYEDYVRRYSSYLVSNIVYIRDK